MRIKKEIKRRLIREALKFSDVWRHVEERGGFIFAASDKPYRTDEENADIFREFIYMVKGENLGYYQIDGMWKEPDTDIKYAEPSLFIPYRDTMTSDEFFDFAVQIARTFDQDGVLVSTPEDGRLGYLLDQSGKIYREFDAINYDAVAEIYSRIRSGSYKGRTFFFEGWSLYRPKCWSDALFWYNTGGM